MGVGETGHDSAFLTLVNHPYCKRSLYGWLGNLAEEGSEVKDDGIYAMHSDSLGAPITEIKFVV